MTCDAAKKDVSELTQTQMSREGENSCEPRGTPRTGLVVAFAVCTRVDLKAGMLAARLQMSHAAKSEKRARPPTILQRIMQ